jgi:hypothetical protein
MMCRICRDGGSILIIPEQTVKIGEGEGQASHQWRLSGKHIIETAQVFREMIGVPGVVDALENSVAEWTDFEIGMCLMHLAQADQREAIRRIEDRLKPRTSYKATAFQRHVEFYKRFGHRAYVLSFNCMRFMRGLSKK